MNSLEIRQTFIDFFKSKGHEIVPSAPMVMKNDPTLMFTNAGMNQFKNIFLGNSKAEAKRIANSQKCLRVSGKHNDLEEVGLDTYHHTMFEMLGNWSFGDYFKKDAIEYAWELLTEVYNLPKDRLYVTIFEGDKEDGLTKDDEAFEVWSKLIDPKRILAAGKKDNFWEMGEMGPCGPASEIHIDLRPEKEIDSIPGDQLVNAGHEQVIEIWNLVFIEFNRKDDGSLHALPQKHIDTGMGLERLCMAMQTVRSNYDTDLFQPIITKIEALTSLKYEKGINKKDVAFRVIADHLRAVAFSIAEAQLPSNTGAGYVIRRILRRAIRYGYSFLNMRKAFICELVPEMNKIMGEHFPEIKKEKDFIYKVIKEEEENFLKTLDKGIQKIDEHQHNEINGDFAFELYDTFGFPIDLTRLIAHEKGWKLDEEGFHSNLLSQKERSKLAGKVDTKDWVVLMEDDEEEFIGYDQLSVQIKITRYREVNVKGTKLYHLVFNLTPFYPEGGGQVGDTGMIKSASESIQIIDTKKENDLIIHISEELPKHPDLDFTAEVDHTKRYDTASNHTATHLLHLALREKLGEHVAQKGSLVHPDYLRFDFSHFQKVEAKDLLEIEFEVNEKIHQGIILDENRRMPLKEAKEMGAMALFGEKYDDVVRVIKFDDSIELCGGTHVDNTLKIGSFKIISEASVASGVRRIEAITGRKVQEYYADQLELIENIRKELKDPKDVLQAVKQLVKDGVSNQKIIDQFKKDRAKNIKVELENEIKEIGDLKFLAKKVDLDPESMKNISFEFKSKFDNLLLVLGSVSDDKAILSVMVSENLVNEKELNAGTIVRELAREIHGGGGGQAFYATAGGKNINGIENALKRAEDFIK